MKKIICLVVAVAMFLFACSCGERRGDEGFFDWQDSLWKVDGTLIEDDTEYKVELHFSETENGKNECRRISYAAPKSLDGLSFTVEGEKITAELEGIRIGSSAFDREAVLRAARMFSLSEEDIYEIKTQKDKTTVARGKADGVSWETVTDSDGLPNKIVYEADGIRSEFVVEKLTMREDNEENARHLFYKHQNCL